MKDSFYVIFNRGKKKEVNCVREGIRRELRLKNVSLISSRSQVSEVEDERKGALTLSLNDD